MNIVELKQNEIVTISGGSEEMQHCVAGVVIGIILFAAGYYFSSDKEAFFKDASDEILYGD